MTLPEDVTTFTLVIDPYSDALGTVANAGMRGCLTPVDAVGRPVHVLHPTTGQVIVPRDITLVLDENGETTIEGLPHTDNSSLVPKPFRYRVLWETRSFSNTERLRAPKDQTFAAPIENGNLVRYNLLEPAPSQPATTVFVHGLPIGGTDQQVLAKSSPTDFDVEWKNVDPAGSADAASAFAVQRGNHIGTQLAETISDFSEAVLGVAPPEDLSPYATVASLDATVASLNGYVTDDELADALEAIEPRFITPAERTKLGTVATGATANATDASLRARETHTGTQTTATISELREYIEDTVGGMLGVAGVDLNITYEDRGGDTGALVIQYTGQDEAGRAETMRDVLGAALVGIGNITVLPNDAGDTIVISTSATVNDTNAALRDRGTHTGTQSADTIVDGTTNKALTAALQALLAEATAINMPNTLAKRNSSGVISVASLAIDDAVPTNGQHATRKDYVDAGDTALDGRLDTAEATLAAATDANTANTLVRRTAAGNATFAQVNSSNQPTATTHLTRKDYVDANGSLVPATTATIPAGGSTSTFNATHIPSTRTYTLGGNWTLAALPTGQADRAGVISLTIKQDATGGRTVTWPSGITWLTPVPTMPTAANATMRVELIWTGTEWLGVAAEADLAAATATNTPNAIVRRTSSGWAFLTAVEASAAPTTSASLTRKDYVDANGSLAPAVNAIGINGTIGPPLSAFPSTRGYVLTGNVTSVTVPTPAVDRAGTLILNIKQAATGGPFTVTGWAAAITWLTLVPTMPTAANATMRVELIWTGTEWLGVAAEADLAAATNASSANTLVRRDTSNGSSFGYVTSTLAPSAANHLTRKDYVDANGALSPIGTNAAPGASYTLSVANLPSARTITLNANLTFAMQATGWPSDRAGVVTLILKQPATGGPYTVTWPALTTLPWAGNAPAPLMPTAANAELIVQLLWTGQAWRGAVVGVF